MAGLAGTGIVGGVLLLVLSFRWGLALILNPNALPQMQSLLANPLNPQSATTITHKALEQSVTEAGLVLGDPVNLSDPQTDTDWLLFPIHEANTNNIVRLRLLQPAEGAGKANDLVDIADVAVPPFAADAILAPFSPEERQAKVAPSEFWAQRLNRLPDPPAPTTLHWLTLEGQWSQQGSRLQYGQILVVDAEKSRLDLLAVWSSPVGQKPQWIDLDGEGMTDLVVDATTSMDPVLLGLQVVNFRGMGPSIQLQPVSWVGIPLDAGSQANRYQKALRLARNGLWGEAYQMFQELKASLSDQWNADAEAQRRLVARHAALTQQQAGQDWSLPSQKIMALLIDGQWATALSLLEDAPQQLEPMMRRLTADQGRLWNRISAAASLEDPAPEIFVWGGLALEARQNRQAAQDWLNRQPVDQATQDRLKTMLTMLDTSTTARSIGSLGQPISDPIESGQGVGLPVQPPIRLEGIVGQVKPLTQPDWEDWYFPNDRPPNLIEGEQWYTVEVPLLQSDRQWRSVLPQTLVNLSPEVIWSALPISQNAAMTMVRWETSTLGVSNNLYAKGLQVNNATITLLASGAATPAADFAPVAFSNDTLVWLSAARQASPSQTVMTPLLEEIRRHHGPLPEHVGTYAFGALLQEVKLHTLDLTGDGRMEQVLTFDRDVLDQLQGLGIKIDRTAHKTVILTEDGRVLYSDLFQPQTLVALTNPMDGLPLSLLVHKFGGYGLLEWSATSQKFMP
jgi:hypothetical protein